MCSKPEPPAAEVQLWGFVLSQDGRGRKMAELTSCLKLVEEKVKEGLEVVMNSQGKKK